MKKRITLLLILFLAVFKLHAQYLSLDELINLRGKDADAVNTYLSSKGWTFSDASEETEDSYSNSTWAYGKQLYTGRAKSFCKLMTADGYSNRIEYKTISKEHYNLIKNKIVLYKMVKVSSTPKDGYLVTMYVGNSYIVQTSLSTDDQTSVPVYAVTVSKRPKAAPTNEPEAADEQDNEETSGQQFAEVLEDDKIIEYKKLINGKYSHDPQAADYILLAEPSNDSCELIYDVSNPSNVIRRVNKGEKIFVISRLPNESHEYCLVYSGGYYGYVKASGMKQMEF